MRRGDVLQAAGVVGVVGLALAGQVGPQGVVEVVGPDAVQPEAARSRSAGSARTRLRWSSAMTTARRSGQAVDGLGDLGQQVPRRGVHDGVGRVQAQPVQVVLVQPVTDVLEHEVADVLAVRAVVVDRVAPGRACGGR